MLYHETQILQYFLSAAIEKGCTVSLFDGEEYAVKRSTDLDLLLKEAAATGEDTFVFRINGERVGSVYCIYGNGNHGLDVITDYTDNDLVNSIVASAKTYSNTHEMY